MADSKWKTRLPSAFGGTVDRLAGLVTSSNRLFDELVQASLLTMDDCKEILQENKTPANRARQILYILQRRPLPSFDQFCDVLLRFPNGRGLYDLLMGNSPDAPSSSPSPEQSATRETALVAGEEGAKRLAEVLGSDLDSMAMEKLQLVEAVSKSPGENTQIAIPPSDSSLSSGLHYLA